MRINAGNAQHIGNRTEQQDAFAFSNLFDDAFITHGGFLAILCDGMGGHKLGNQASQTAVKAMRQTFESKPREESVKNTLRRSLLEANLAVHQMAKENEVEGNAGTTLVAVVVFSQSLNWVSVGDSHIYLYRNGVLSQLNKDHVYANELSQKVLNGEISQEEAEKHPERKALTSCLGDAQIPVVDQNDASYDLEPGDRILLCSDGLYNTLSEERITNLLSQGSAQDTADKLVEEVIEGEKRNQDNVTVVILDIFSDKDLIENKSQKSFWAASRLQVLCLVFLLALFVYLVTEKSGVNYWGCIGL